jgi:hypothetical protein
MRGEHEVREPGEADLRSRLARLEAEVGALGRLIRGNGEGGLRTQVELLGVRVEGLQSQWKWIVGVLTAVAVAVAQASLRR